ncbi:ATP-binding protein [Euzebya sp.]|uniref:ATP-binding protein n=1 Tax=Euzebya sp. TaxID=1971409 RepID=UPI003513436A
MHRSVLNNPFAPGSGAVPDVWVGRDDELADVEARLVPRRLAGLFERGRTYLGDPGLGKSVLVNRIADDRGRAGDLVAAPLRLARGRDPLAALAAAVLPLVPSGERVASRISRAVDRVRDVGLLGASVGVSAPAEDRYTGLAELLGSLAAHAKSLGRLLVIRVDEVQNLAGDELSQLLTVLGDLLEARVPASTATGEEVEEYLPVVVLLSGLPQFAQQAEDAGVTFSRRFATAFLEPFTDDEVRAALTFAFADGYPVVGDSGPTSVLMERRAGEALIERCLGDPFLFQLAGAAAWDAETGPVITADDVAAGWLRVRREVDAHVRNRVAGLTDWQLEVLTAAATLGPAADGTAIARAVGRTRSSEIGSTLQGLVAKRLLAHDPAGYRIISRSLAAHLRAS